MRPLAFLASLLIGVVAACTSDLESTGSGRVGALPPPPSDETAAKIDLGRALFWDPILSGGRDVACSTCHHPAFAYADGRAASIGVGGIGLGPARTLDSRSSMGRVSRNSQTIIDTAFNGLVAETTPSFDPIRAPMFWDNRAKSLEEQALGPIRNRDEMRGDAYREEDAEEAVVTRLRAIPEYVALFRAAFGPSSNITKEELALAIATFERTLVATDTSFDRWARGEENAMTARQKRGLRRFMIAGCSGCHGGPMFSDFELHRLDVPSPIADRGDGLGRFRTPSLRNVTNTAPYMHNGSLATLGDVLDFYEDIADGDRPNNGDAKLVDLELNGQDHDDIIAFLHALGDGAFDRLVPERVPSGLPPGGR